jgi:hypothetical protein
MTFIIILMYLVEGKCISNKAVHTKEITSVYAFSLSC